MPPANPGSLSPADAAGVTAYILEQNGAQPGLQGLKATATIGDVANGQPPVETVQDQGSGGGGLVALGAGTSATPGVSGTDLPPAQYGVTVPGTVSNYVPVTPEMLRNPPPQDWLMARRNYQAWSYSPLGRSTALTSRISS